MSDGPAIRFVRLPAAPLDELAALLNEPRNARHMPLAGPMDSAAVADWVRAKDAQWAVHGYGPEAILLDGVLAGWGGFQREDAGADLALVLLPSFWGEGAAIAAALLDRGFGELGLDAVVAALPYSRRPDRVMERLGFLPDGEAVFDGIRFRQYRLTRSGWRTRRNLPGIA